ncbi:MAG: mycothiol system anti-sigma-R factor [Actinomycetes bacterium]
MSKESPSTSGVSAHASGNANSTGNCGPGPCGDAKAHLWEYVDGELSEDDCARIRQHIEACPPCGELYINERKVKDAVARACRCECAPQDVRGKVMAMVTQLRIEMCGRAAAARKSAD